VRNNLFFTFFFFFFFFFVTDPLICVTSPTSSSPFPVTQPGGLLSTRALDKAQNMKEALVNLVSGSLLNEPQFFSEKDPTRHMIEESVAQVVTFDPEFILKLALYTRDDLGIRLTANFLLALAAFHPQCRTFLLKYFNASTRLPSDWMEVGELFRTFETGSKKNPSFPAALRKAMVAKFPEFDVYQLGKYNKDKSAKEPKKDPNVVPDEEPEKTRFDFRCTIKFLIRVLHIAEPVYPTMCILGKKYPDTREEFMRSKLPGEFKEDLAGKRMKLPTPETWETEVSLKGNKASTWESLIDHRKLPFMAMLRNLRNLINAGISEKHHAIILKKVFNLFQFRKKSKQTTNQYCD
jgi:telomerase protein component 1